MGWRGDESPQGLYSQIPTRPPAGCRLLHIGSQLPHSRRLHSSLPSKRGVVGHVTSLNTHKIRTHQQQNNTLIVAGRYTCFVITHVFVFLRCDLPATRMPAPSAVFHRVVSAFFARTALIVGGGDGVGKLRDIATKVGCCV